VWTQQFWKHRQENMKELFESKLLTYKYTLIHMQWIHKKKNNEVFCHAHQQSCGNNQSWKKAYTLLISTNFLIQIFQLSVLPSPYIRPDNEKFALALSSTKLMAVNCFKMHVPMYNYIYIIQGNT
jgi:uncharacterized membrane protein